MLFIGMGGLYPVSGIPTPRPRGISNIRDECVGLDFIYDIGCVLRLLEVKVLFPGVNLLVLD